MLNQFIVIIKKELLDARRDLKAIMPALMMPLVFALMTYGSISFVVALQDQPASLELAVQGADRATPLMDALREAGINIVAAPVDPAGAVSARELDMVLIIPEDFNQQFRSQRRASLDLIWDISRMESHASVNRVKQQIQHWAATTGALRLLLQGLSPEVSQVLAINDVNIASDQKMASKMLAGLPMIFLLLAFVSGAGICSEMAAGERENNTLEPLMITPVAPAVLLAGKLSAAFLFTLGVTVVGVGLQLWSVNAAPLEQLGLRLSLGVEAFIILMFILVPVILLATALQLLVSFLSKSFKDAQTYNQLLVLLPVVPGLYVLLANTGITTANMWVPLLGPQLLIVEIFSGQPVHWLDLSIAALTSVAAATLCAAIAVHLMKEER